MKGLTTKEVDDVFFEAGFMQTEAAGLFRRYEYPSERARKEHNILAFIRAMFYAGRSELSIWVNLIHLSSRAQYKEGGNWSGYVDSQEDVAAAIKTANVFRLHLAVEELVKWQDERFAHAPTDLVAAARSPFQSIRLPSEQALADWLLDRGIEF